MQPMQRHSLRRASLANAVCSVCRHGLRSRRWFRAAAKLDIVKPYLLADIGEGITECQIIQWFVQPGARVQQFDKICEVQSDKASVEITSRYDGVVRKLHYDADDMAKVGKPLLDIDMQDDPTPPEEPAGGAPLNRFPESEMEDTVAMKQNLAEAEEGMTKADHIDSSVQESRRQRVSTLATPAVRHLTKQLDLDLADIPGTGKDGRVSKEDVHRHERARSSGRLDKEADSAPKQALGTARAEYPNVQHTDQVLQLSPMQQIMYKTMTRSLSVPHFLYTDNVDLSHLNGLRRKLNQPSTSASSVPGGQHTRLSVLPFILKAVSMALTAYPTVNAHLRAPSIDPSHPASGSTRGGDKSPSLTVKARHDIGVAIDTPTGLVVPVVRNLQDRTISDIGAEISRLAALARAGELSAGDLSGATFTVSNIGSIGGTAVAPVVVSPQVAIVGVGKSRPVPAFGPDGTTIIRREECVFSWSADHRILDGATVARCAEMVRLLLEDVEKMLVNLR